MNRNILVWIGVAVASITSFYYLSFILFPDSFYRFDKIILNIVISILIGLMVYLYFNIFLQMNRRARLKKSLRLLDEGFANETIETKDDVDNILRFFNSSVLDDSDKLTLSSFLNKYDIYLRDEKKHETLKTNKELITKFIEIEARTRPYNNLPDYERSLLMEIDEAMANNKQFSLLNLSNAIESKEKRLERAEKINSWSIPIGLIGVIFSVLSIIIPLIFTQ